MWTNTAAALAIRTAFIKAPEGSVMYFRARDLVDALDFCYDSGYWPGESEADIETKEETLARKLEESTSEHITSLLLYGNVFPIDVAYEGGKIAQGNGHHRLAVLAHYDMPVKVRKAGEIVSFDSFLPSRLFEAFGAILPESY